MFCVWICPHILLADDIYSANRASVQVWRYLYLGSIHSFMTMDPSLPSWRYCPLAHSWYEMIACSDKSAVSSLLDILHSKLWWRFSRVIPRDPQTKKARLWLAIKTIMFKVESPHRFFSFNTATVWGHTHDDVHWYARKSRGILMISYLLCPWLGCCSQR